MGSQTDSEEEDLGEEAEDEDEDMVFDDAEQDDEDEEVVDAEVEEDQQEPISETSESMVVQTCQNQMPQSSLISHGVAFNKSVGQSALHH